MNILKFIMVLAVLIWWQVASIAHAHLMGQEPAAITKPPQSSMAKTEQQSTTSIPPDSAAAQEALGLAQVQTEVSDAHEPNAHALAKALGVDLAVAGDDPADSPSSSLQDLGDLDGDGISEIAFKRMQSTKADAPGNTAADEPPSWQLFLLAWDGAQWRASKIAVGFETYELQVLTSLIPGSRQIALVVYAGAQETPYPAIFQIKDHAAALVWDGRSDESLYEGFVHGRIEFRDSEEGASPVMIASGRADPGLLHFPQGGQRGFDVQTVYAWDGHGFIPKRTQYQTNEDYKIYQFISALHLHDYRSAYALIDPAKFLKTDAPSLEVFRKKIEGSWPEFVVDNIFEVPDVAAKNPDNFAFELTDENKLFVYVPFFGAGPKLLITGLERHEATAGDH